MKNKRSRIDFTKHQLDIVNNENVLIHTLHLNNLNRLKVVFINCQGILSVTGDFGNWIFAREFHPTPNGSVSDGYWCEKLRMHSEQTSSVYDEEATLEEIKDYRDNHLSETKDEQEISWLEQLESLVDDELEYTYYAYREKPENVDYEYIPFGKTMHPRLGIIFDAFEAICEKLK